MVKLQGDLVNGIDYEFDGDTFPETELAEKFLRVFSNSFGYGILSPFAKIPEICKY